MQRFPIQYLRYMRIAILLFRYRIRNQFGHTCFEAILPYVCSHRLNVLFSPPAYSPCQIIIQFQPLFSTLSRDSRWISVHFKYFIRLVSGEIWPIWKYLSNNKLTHIICESTWLNDYRKVRGRFVNHWQRAFLSLIFRINYKVSGVDTSLIIIRLIYWPTIIVICYVKDIW